MREILFLGKRERDGEWEYGDLWCNPYGKRAVCIVSPINDQGTTGGNEVLPETVGQYTGLTDKNGRRIFEGDLVRVDGVETVFVIVYVDGVFRIAERIRNTNFYSNSVHSCYSEMSVIGNIFDNPELVEVKQNG